MSKLFFAVVALMSTIVFARPDYPNVDGQVYGGWIAPTYSENGFTIKSRLYFNPASILAKSICSYGGVTLEVEVAGRATFTADTITSLSRVENSISEVGMTCSSSIDPMTFNYFVTANILTLMVQGESLTLNREM